MVLLYLFPSQTHFSHPFLPLISTAACCIAAWKVPQFSAMWVLCIHLIPFSSVALPGWTSALSFTLYAVPESWPQHRKICWFIYYSQRSPGDTYFMANVGWINLFINIDGYPLSCYWVFWKRLNNFPVGVGWLVGFSQWYHEINATNFL